MGEEAKGKAKEAYAAFPVVRDMVRGAMGDYYTFGRFRTVPIERA